MVKFSKFIANYFVPYTSGKFIATCLMLSPDMYPMLTQDEIFYRISNKHLLRWNEIEYSDIDFWWKEPDCDWFNSPHWRDNLAAGPLDAINKNRYVFYTCHESGTVKFLRNHVCRDLEVLTIVPDEELCKKNYLSKNLIDSEPVYETSRIKQDFDNYFLPDTNLIFYQRDIYDEVKFKQGMESIVDNLKINLDLSLVLKYRNLYLNNPFNEHTS